MTIPIQTSDDKFGFEGIGIANLDVFVSLDYTSEILRFGFDSHLIECVNLAISAQLYQRMSNRAIGPGRMEDSTHGLDEVCITLYSQLRRHLSNKA